MSFANFATSIGRIILLVVVIAGIFAFFASRCLGPGISDFTKPILNGYEYGDNGGYEKYIGYRDSKGLAFVIDSRVDEYAVEKELLRLVRKPREVYFEGEVSKGRLLNICELWTVDTLTHQITKEAEIDHMGRCNLALFEIRG